MATKFELLQAKPSKQGDIDDARAIMDNLYMQCRMNYIHIFDLTRNQLALAQLGQYTDGVSKLESVERARSRSNTGN